MDCHCNAGYYDNDGYVGDHSTRGTYTGNAFAAFDFSANPEDLIVAVDGIDRIIALSSDVTDVTAAVTALSGLATTVAAASAGT